ncbi:asparagine--tRNA ligase [Acetilactobacillus jinshanensis]|uniref:Asparagine--tRNA ligase n=1 Tax=Acetilactobacillus jinshanensis TaxID=1720083 RepID=A0A4P6ZMU5_9LACO|nr:asparagine--tRNA ligase [Acetilactobacillus jinshanensis]QBP18550.1 asparagine--tRNA ligase [Acetilactobacillus jinshanensis]URL61424.1 asparagine--tRNA ligase [uncultured bacterium]
MKQIHIADAKDHVGETVKIGVWLTDRRSSGKIVFLQLRDGTAFFQGVVNQKNVSAKLMDVAKHIGQETSMWVTGTIDEDKRSHFGYEMQVKDIDVIQKAENYPITPKDHGIDFLLDHRHLWIRSRRPFAVLKIRDEVKRATYRFFHKHGFVQFDAPIFTANAPEGTTHLFHTEYFDHDAYLSQSGQLYEEAGAEAFGRVYSFGPTFRAEKSKTRRHLTEFWMIEPEMAFCHQDQSLKIQEQYIAYLVQSIIDNCQYELKLLGRNVDTLKAYTKLPYPRITYNEAVKMLHKGGLDFKWGNGFGSPEESFLADQYKRPVFVMNYPKSAKPFYMKPDPDDDKLVICADLLAPEGYGEIIGGSERATDYNYLKKQIKKYGLNEKSYDWYLDLRKYGSVPHSGFGMGLERFLTWITLEDHVRECIPFPRLLNRLHP